MIWGCLLNEWISEWMRASIVFQFFFIIRLLLWALWTLPRRVLSFLCPQKLCALKKLWETFNFMLFFSGRKGMVFSLPLFQKQGVWCYCEAIASVDPSGSEYHREEVVWREAGGSHYTSMNKRGRQTPQQRPKLSSIEWAIIFLLLPTVKWRHWLTLGFL